ncbi:MULTISPECIES: MaoC family dehydratase N-terminal domain-containing protein [Ramlibacter]|uniref:MaoC family dehydratase N-terminal domain-containing protein n=1 Tax=Ramlibacter aquaticus TaxID=2780094 RepID=A0ABR9SJ66_9BURK|nr:MULTISPECIES: MaoC family dehydratase N-terminal domain-containing protein [Ramlibacter]MBE7942403.1 MaoC family dehydratase N-terminal domain-containing protein [Ramlibacter aquaticus]
MTEPRLEDWIGRSATQDDLIDARTAGLLAATLDRKDRFAPGDALPPLWHWTYFVPRDLRREIGPDGHRLRGGFLPPVPLPRRMWAGGRLRFEQALRIGEPATRVSRIESVARKSGKSGELVFVTVSHEISGPRGLALREEHDIVYRGLPAPGSVAPPPPAAPQDAQFHTQVVPDPVLLFRYSALTFNGHRIHYDQPYVTQEEGYPGLIVHGPLIATLLAGQLRTQAPGRALAAFEFRALGPLFDIAPFEVCGRIEGDAATLWARGPQGQLAMQASAQLA